jgi:hypothetical protein
MTEPSVEANFPTMMLVQPVSFPSHSSKAGVSCRAEEKSTKDTDINNRDEMKNIFFQFVVLPEIFMISLRYYFNLTSHYQNCCETCQPKFLYPQDLGYKRVSGNFFWDEHVYTIGPDVLFLKGGCND